MSLFKVRDWWSTSCGHCEKFDCGTLCVANIDNDPKGHDKILVGSHQGILRLYGPCLNRQDDGTLSGFKPNDMLLETQLSQPILQMQVGRLSGVSEKLFLAVLHARKVAVFGISVISGAIEHGTHYHLSLAYEHTLKRSAYSMVLGPFGGVKNQDFICIQSLDGTLTFFEQESFAFSRFLPGFLLPGPVAYVQRTDTLITVSSSWQLESYKYQTLAVATDSNSKEESQNIATGKKVIMDWSFTLGEAAVEIEVVTKKDLIFVLGERHWFCFNDYGSLRFVKRLDYHPSCFYSYLAPMENESPFLIVASHAPSLYVYQEANLKWAAQLPSVPVAIRKANLTDLQGVLVFLSEDGELACAYLGTDPAIFVPPTIESRELNYAETDKEMNELQKVIKASQKSNFTHNSSSTKADLNINVTVANNPEPSIHDQRANTEAMNQAPMVSVKIQLTTTYMLHNVKLSVQVPTPLLITQPVFTFPSISESVHVVISVYTQHSHLPSGLNGFIVAMYSSKDCVPQVVTKEFALPLRLLLRPCVPVKEAKNKITITTNRPAINLLDLYADLSGDETVSTSQALGFEYYSGAIVTLLAAKVSQRYRLQCESYEAMWFVTCDLLQRLRKHFSRDSDLLISYSNNVPIQEYFETIDAHFQCRQDQQKIHDFLAQLATQYRAVQRRLLTKFKDKTPTPLNNLDLLLESTHRQMLKMVEAAEHNEHELQKTTSNLNCATQFTLLLLKLLTGMKEEEFALLQSAFCINADNSMEQGWEESVDAHLTHLLRTSLAKPGKDPAPAIQSITFPKDISRLKKHITLVIDRVSKGGRLTGGKQPVETHTTKDPKIPQSIEEEDEAEADETDESSVPTGSRFGERKSSARPSTARTSSAKVPKTTVDEHEEDGAEKKQEKAAISADGVGPSVGGKEKPISKNEEEGDGDNNGRRDSLYDIEANITREEDIIEF